MEGMVRAGDQPHVPLPSQYEQLRKTGRLTGFGPRVQASALEAQHLPRGCFAITVLLRIRYEAYVYWISQDAYSQVQSQVRGAREVVGGFAEEPDLLRG